MRGDQGDDRARAQAHSRHRGRGRRAGRRAAGRGVGVAIERRWVAIAAVLALAGCGGGPEESREAALEAAQAYVDALEEGDGEAACELLTEGAVDELEAQAGAACADAVGESLGGDGAGGELEGLGVRDLNVAGNVATVTIEGGPTGAVTSQLRKEHGEWKLASPGG